MWRKKPEIRSLISVWLALVFAIAVMPGSMAMPAHNATQHSMDCASASTHHCDHIKPANEQGSPCKNMQVCMGMFGCLGMAALAHDAVPPVLAIAAVHPHHLYQTRTGLTFPPDGRPPIG